MFDGKVGSNRTVSAAGRTRGVLSVEDAKKQREIRALEKKRNSASIKIQAIVRGLLTRSKVSWKLTEELRKKLLDIYTLQQVFIQKQLPPFSPPVDSLVGIFRLILLISSTKRIIDSKLCIDTLNILSQCLSHPNPQFNIIHYLTPTSNNQKNDEISLEHLFSTGYQRVLFQISKIVALALKEYMNDNIAFDVIIHFLSALLPKTVIVDHSINSTHQTTAFIAREIIAQAACKPSCLLLVKILSGDTKVSSDKVNELLLKLILLSIGEEDSSQALSSFIQQNNSISPYQNYQKSVIQNRKKCLITIGTTLLSIIVTSESTHYKIFDVLYKSSYFKWDSIFEAIQSNDAIDVLNKLSLMSNYCDYISSQIISDQSLFKLCDLTQYLHVKATENNYIQVNNDCYLSPQDWINSLANIFTVQKHNLSQVSPMINLIRGLEFSNEFLDEELNRSLISKSVSESSTSSIESWIHAVLGNMHSSSMKQSNFHSNSSIPGKSKMEIFTLTLEKILKTLSNRNILPSLFDNINESLIQFPYGTDSNNHSTMPMLVDNNNGSTSHSNSFLSSQLNIINTFTTLLISLHTPSLTGSPSKISSSLLTSLAFSRPNNPFVSRLWKFMISAFGRNAIEMIVNNDESLVLVSSSFLQISQYYQLEPSFLYQSIVNSLLLLCLVFSHQLSAVDDEELLVIQTILSMNDILDLTITLRQWLYRFFWIEPSIEITLTTLLSSNVEYNPIQNQSIVLKRNNPSNVESSSSRYYDSYMILVKLMCQQAATKLFNQILIRNERRQFLPSDCWQWLQISPFELSLVDGADLNEFDFHFRNPKIKHILSLIPQVIPFKQRAVVFQTLLDNNKANYYNAPHSGGIAAAMGFGNAVRIQVHRDQMRIFQDSFEGLNSIGDKLKGKIKIEFISEQGMVEDGIDGGGLFKEYMDAFSKAAFNPNFGLFIPTSQQLLTPNPGASQIIPSYLQYYHFIGRMLGKTIYEKLLFESEFAGGFLNVLLGRINDLDDLFSLDEQVYKSLMDLKHMANNDKDISSLELYFETTRSVFGEIITEEIIPNGSNIKVDHSNITLYIHTLANHLQNKVIVEQCRALLAGFRTMIPIEWIRMFNTKELQLLISGDKRPIDLQDLQDNVHYGSGYHPSQPYIQAFWQVVAEMSLEDQQNLLKFVTSCPRQPLLGFKQLNPSFSIQQVSAYEYSGSTPRLPSAATCMNLLKLPLYNDIEMLKEKLLYAIRSNSGFDLS
eukprot:gene7199-9826_t